MAVDWNMAVSVGIGVLVGTVTLVLLVLLTVWLIDRFEKWREARKQPPSHQRVIRELTQQNHELQRRLREAEADRQRLEVIARELLQSSKQEDAPQEVARVRTRYERLVGEG